MNALVTRKIGPSAERLAAVFTFVEFWTSGVAFCILTESSLFGRGLLCCFGTGGLL
jgi:hypothetical protein